MREISIKGQPIFHRILGNKGSVTNDCRRKRQKKGNKVVD